MIIIDWGLGNEYFVGGLGAGIFSPSSAASAGQEQEPAAPEVAQLHATTKISNIKGSIQKYFIDNLEGNEGENVIVDADLESVRDLTTWIHLNFFDHTNGNKFEWYLLLAVASREDDEGYALARMEDNIDKYLYSGDGQPKSISFYDISNLPNLNELGKIFLFPQSRWPVTISADDRTKFRVMPVIARLSIKLAVN